MRDAARRLGRRLYDISGSVYSEYRRVNVSFMASSVAYQAFVSVLPLFVVVYVLVTAVVGPQFAAEVLAASEDILPPQGRELLAQSITNDIPTNATVVSVLVLLWGSLGLFTTLETAFATIYRTSQRVRTLTKVVDAVVTFGVILLATVVAVAVTSLAIVSHLPALGAGSSVLLFAGLILVFFPMYYRFPNAAVSVREALLGSIIAAFGWTVLQVLFQFYLQYVASADVPGLLGTVLVFLTWLYFASYVLIMAAVVNVSVLASSTE